MTNYEIKAFVLESGLVEVERKVSKAFYKNDLRLSFPFPEAIKDCFRDIPFAEAKQIYDEWHSSEERSKFWHEAEKVNYASYKRVKRLRRRITALLTKPCLFLTLTFTDEVLNSTNADTRRQYVRRFLSELGAYVGNIDFGKLNEREHYHALLQVSTKIDYTSWQYGNLDGKKVVNPNSQALSKYISKLTNHAIKETTKGCRIIYSR